jgi:hypothetical protein
MNKQCVRWKPFRAKNIRGTECDSGFADLLDHYDRGHLIARILKMDRKEALDFVQAACLAQEKFQAARQNGHFGHKPGECFWYLEHFVEWIASLGYHIELTGDEFEPYEMSSQLQ